MSSVCPPSGRPKDGSRVFTKREREGEREDRTGKEAFVGGLRGVTELVCRFEKFRVKRAQSAAEKGRKSVLV